MVLNHWPMVHPEQKLGTLYERHRRLISFLREENEWNVVETGRKSFFFSQRESKKSAILVASNVYFDETAEGNRLCPWLTNSGSVSRVSPKKAITSLWAATRKWPVNAQISPSFPFFLFPESHRITRDCFVLLSMEPNGSYREIMIVFPLRFVVCPRTLTFSRSTFLDTLWVNYLYRRSSETIWYPWREKHLARPSVQPSRFD